MSAAPEPASWSGLEISPGLFAARLQAPVILPRATARAYRGFLASLLEGSDVPGGALEAALSAGSGILEGAGEIVFHANQLADPATGLDGAKAAVKGLLLTAGALLRHRNAAYVLQQVAEIARSRAGGSSGAALPRIARAKDLMTPLEAALERLGVSRELEPERRGPLLVHLDLFYDDATVEIERALRLASSNLDEARALAPELLTRLYRDFARASFADHLLAEHEKGKDPGEAMSLIDLLRELGEALERS
jgi:hypothetical protein